MIFVASTNRHTAAYAETSTHLFQVAASGGEPRQLTKGDESFGSARFSPDGRALYFIRTPNTVKTYNLSRLARLPWPVQGEIKTVTTAFDRVPASFAVSPDGRTIFLTAEEASHEKLYSIAADGSEVRLVMDMTLGVYANLAIPEKAQSTIVLANWESAVNPAEIVRIDVTSRTQKALTRFNADRVAQIDWQPLRQFWFTSKRGKRINNLVALPPKFDENKKYPLFVLIHGGPHGMWRDQFFIRWNYHLLAQPGYVVLMTDYTGSTGYGEKFAQEIQARSAEGARRRDKRGG